MARRCFFSFHYQRDVWRAQQVKNAWVTKDREDAGFFDGSVFESKKRQGDEILKRFLTDALKGTSVVCALVGGETAHRRWVRYELVRGFEQGKGLLAVRVHGLKNQAQQLGTYGPNILDYLGYELDSNNDRIRFKELDGSTWKWYSDLPAMKYSALPYVLTSKNASFSNVFSTHDYTSENGYLNIGTWIENAAKTVGR